MENRDCPAGASCLLDGSGGGGCSIDVDLSCETGVGRACAGGLACVSDRCERTCSTASDCPLDGECRPVSGGATSFCFDPRRTADAGAADGGDGGVGPDAGIESVPVVDVCISSVLTCAVGQDTRVRCWGEGNNGALGHGDETSSTVPVAVLQADGVTPLERADHVVCGLGFGCAHLTSGEVVCWGDGSFGQLGAHRGVGFVADAVRTSTDEAVTASVGRLSASGAHVCVLDTADHVVCWGENAGLIDDVMPASAILPPRVPSALVGVLDVDEILVAETGGCVKRANETVACWGGNEWGEAARTPSRIFEPLATVDVGGSPFEIAAGARHRVVHLVGAADPLRAWGFNHSSQLGLPWDLPGGRCADGASMGCFPMPQDPTTRLPAMRTIGAGGEASCGVLAGATGAVMGHVRCWGENLSGHAGWPGAPDSTLASRDVEYEDGSPVEGADRVIVGPTSACAILVDHSLVCWGSNASGQLARPADSGLHRASRVTIPSIP